MSPALVTRLRRRLQRLRLERWQRNLYTIVLAETVAILGFSISNPFLPFYIQELGVTDFAEVAFWVGLINSAAPICMALSSPVWGVLADRFGRKPMLVRAMLGGALILGLLAMARSVQQAAALRIFQGALTGTVAAATTLVATSVPRERCGYALGLLQTAVFAGSSLGPSFGGIVGGTFGYRVAFAASGCLLLLAGVLVTFLVHEEFSRQPREKQHGNAFLASVRAIGADRALFSMIALLMMHHLAASVTAPVLPLYVQTLVPDTRAASTATGWILGATAAANAVAAVWLGRSADRLGRRRVLLVCLGVGSLACFPQMLTRHPAQLLALRVVLGFALGAVAPVANAIIAERAPEGRQGGTYGISTSLNACGGALGPMLGTLVVTTWSVGGVFVVTGSLLAIVVLFVAVMTQAPAKRQPVALAPGRRFR
ncbi:MAG: MFS transporter [Anaerolineae bacterium]|nr:MFS transporter [Anaerolineae bacterium]